MFTAVLIKLCQGCLLILILRRRVGCSLGHISFLCRLSPFFFSNGLTTDIFQSLQKQALLSEALTMWVIRGIRIVNTHLRMSVGMRSSLQLLVCMPAIKLVS